MGLKEKLRKLKSQLTGKRENNSAIGFGKPKKKSKKDKKNEEDSPGKLGASKKIAEDDSHTGIDTMSDDLDNFELTDRDMDTDEIPDEQDYSDSPSKTFGVSKELYNQGFYHKESRLSNYISRSKLMGKRVTLRCLEKEDLVHLWRWIGKNAVINKIGLPLPISKEDLEDWISYQVNDNPNDMAIYIIEQEDNIPIGLCGLYLIENTSRRAQYSVFIGDHDFLGHDYGAEATYLILDLAFNILNLNRIESLILDDDERSIHSFSKNGFRKEGLLYEYTYIEGEYKNVIFLSILKKEYEEFMEQYER